MILLFPDTDTLRLALTSSIVGPDVTLAPATATFDSLGRIYVEPSVSLSRATSKNLDRIGVKGSKRHGSERAEKVANWLQLVPVVKDAGPTELSSQAAVLFELDSPDALPALVTEMLRLGNDRQSFRWFDESRILLRVIGPPYYTLLRALEKSTAGTEHAVRAYIERSPRVWVEIGQTHPLAPQLRAPDGQLLLIRAPREWLFLDEAPFQDVYDILQFSLPATPVGWTETQPAKKLTVPLRLTAGNAADVPELWVLRDGAAAQLDTFVRDADERLVQRLTFAVVKDRDDNRTVILRTRPSKLAPPALMLERAIGFKPFWKLPNLYLPAGKRLHPTLRRDAVRRLLADDPDQVVWLNPDGTGGFTPESVPDAAFRSLEDWVDYVIEVEREPLAAWIEATRFDFDQFVCRDPGGPPKPKPDKEPIEKEVEVRRSPSPPAKIKSKTSPTKPAEASPAPEAKPPSEWRIRREAMETQFIAVEGTLDDPERRALWPQLAAANAGEGSQTEAAICWLNALWDADPLPADWLAQWAHSDWPSARALTAEDFDRRLKVAIPSAEDCRAVVAGFLLMANQVRPPSWLTARLPAIQKYLVANEGSLPVRAVWLAGQRLAAIAGDDVLGLARLRDRLLQRLLDEGLRPERDLPLFLRYAGLKDSRRLRVVRDQSLELHRAVRKWTEHIPVNLPYVDLMFAFALAKLGESTQAKRLLDDARPEMEVPIPGWKKDERNGNNEPVVAAIASNYLSKAFQFRIEQVLAGKPAGPLSAELFAELEAIKLKGKTEGTNNPFSLAEYVINRMRDQSRVLEPHERLDPYSNWTQLADTLRRELAALHAIRDPAKFADRVRRLYKVGLDSKPIKEVRFYLLHEALPLSGRVGESFAAELLALVPAALADAGEGSTVVLPADMPKKPGELLERALFLAGHFDRRDLVEKLIGQFVGLVRHVKEDLRFKLINVVAAQCLRSLKKLGMRDEIDRFLTHLQSEVLQGSNLADLRRKYAAKPEVWAALQQTMLSLAAGWMTFGLNERAAPILDDARNELLGPPTAKLSVQQTTELARAYVVALGHGSSESGLQRITELFQKIDPERIKSAYTTGRYYSRFHLNLVEEVIFALVSDEFSLGPTGRRWLDDDEYLVRKRIHADMKRARERSGL